tara:strand:- start:41529 stop:41771 length:243 start_codon:yes stop_codon:yes gene_type:complete
MKVKYKIEREYIYGWDDGCFNDDNGIVPTLFETEEEAQKEIDEHREAIEFAIKTGNMDKDSRDDNLRITEVIIHSDEKTN